MGNNFLQFTDKIGNSLAPLHVKGGPWLSKTWTSTFLTAHMVHTLTGHAPIGKYRARLLSGDPFCSCDVLRVPCVETQEHLYHMCPLLTRKQYKHLKECSHFDYFIQFLKDNPSAFEFLGNLKLSTREGSTLRESKGKGAPAPKAPSAKYQAGNPSPVRPVRTTGPGAKPPPRGYLS